MEAGGRNPAESLVMHVDGALIICPNKSVQD